MEVLDYDNIEKIDKELEELRKVLGRLDDEKERVLTLKPTMNEKTVRPKINYKLNERKYDYETITKLEKLEETQKVTVTPKIDKNWLAANMEAPDIMDFYDESEMNRPSSNFNKDFANHKKSLVIDLSKTIDAIKDTDELHQLNSHDFEYLG